MILDLYAGATRAATPWLRHMLKQRAKRGKEIPERLAEREGKASFPRPSGKLVWVHAASVGETMSALPLIKRLVENGSVLLTTGTVTSAKMAAQLLPKGAIHQFVPLDTPAWGAKFLDYWQPSAAVFLESEIWPNLLRGCDKRQIPRFLINARMSRSSAQRWKYMKASAYKLLNGFKAIHAQSAEDAMLLRRLGAASVLEWGNLKFVAQPLNFKAETLVSLAHSIPGSVWLACSTHQGEEDIIYSVHQELAKEFQGLITIIAPRHPERGAQVAALCGAAPQRSKGELPLAGTVYVADTIGELGLFFRLAPFAFIGNSLFSGGGHNIIEPAKLARPIICGPHMENFGEALECLKQAQALVQVSTKSDLIVAVRRWLLNPAEAKEAGRNAKEAFSSMENLPNLLANLIVREAA